uniref:O-fucosyltransferase family protein n=1 Tax=Rhizophora mucronata TaxID=61149 RepID=A0A2P2QQZ4_RHIMU
MEADNSTAIQLSRVWKHKRRFKVQRPCTNLTYGQDYATVEESSSSSGYLIVEANGGLNQQRSAICNAVAIAGLLNAVLVIPYFEFNSVWRDPR